jgi:hypothetical protein
MDMVQDELVNVAVPRSRLAEVYALLGSPPVATALPAPAERMAESDGWTDELISRAYQESASRMRVVFDHLAKHPDQWVSAVQLADVLDITQAQVRGVLGGFGHRLRSRYNLSTWPCNYRWDDQASTSFYRMSEERAEAFKRAKDRA